MRKDNTQYELGRYKKKVEDQAKEIADYKEREEGFRQALSANNALVCALLLTVGADEEHPVTLQLEAINEAIGTCEVGVGIDEESRAYKLCCIKAVKNDGGEERPV